MPTIRPARPSFSRPAPPRTAGRICYLIGEQELRHNEKYRRIAETASAGNAVAGATLVGSRTTTGSHAPAIDLDLPAALVAQPGGLDLWVDVACGYRAWRNLLRVATSVGVVRRGLRGQHSCTSRPRRSARYAQLRPGVIDDSARMEVWSGLGPTLAACNFDQAVVHAGMLAGPPRRGPGPVMRQPWRLPLAVDAMLVPSTHNVHLYLECELRWPQYARLLHAMTQAGLVQPGYYGASVARQNTYLRLPWVKKAPDGKLRAPEAPF
jgi:hypothetical protein